MDDLNTLLADFIAKRDAARAAADAMAVAVAAATDATASNQLAQGARDIARRTLIDAINAAS